MLYQLLLYPQVVDIHPEVVDIHPEVVGIHPEAVGIHLGAVGIHLGAVVAAQHGGTISNFLLQFRIKNLHDKYSFTRIKRTFIL